jgi:hypothetical protein
MNQMSDIGFGPDITLLAGYATRTNDRLGVFDLLVKNTQLQSAQLGVGNQPTAGADAPVLRLQLMEWDGTTSPSGWKAIGGGTGPGGTSEIVAGGTTTIHMNLSAQKLGFFGSGYLPTAAVGYGQPTGSATNTPCCVAANISVVMDNKSDLRGGEIDIVVTGRRGWGYDDGFSKATLTPNWGSLDAGGNVTGIVNQ